MTQRTAIFPGSFDPITNGHIDLISRALTLCDRLVVAIGIHPSKKPLFTFEERRELILESSAERFEKERIEVTPFEGLVVDAANKVGATILIRGLRNGSDLDYEMPMAGMNGVMAADVQTVFLPPSPDVAFITATLVRQIAAMDGDVTPFVPPQVVAALRNKF
ncbi:pantetheine-phosphate adenylyltransferase [Notoacmeibacter sp. MSK16QG-6]|uniref:pantetheine-phosphate adenylyltransferase n=1 Tax=Notoacmeibacter sp. MSK16QG-6 TaxID=2957982 RepID=UPI00209D82E8|nr:pantetheine-phosphate adenylyltransferase [Notoacmeibacter sp. MSK16QG-6]MCP1200723.1 pantetheine-phosphate adenylyltransferase [Notoacmeibacter sp. MSK16QG-6]